MKSVKSGKLKVLLVYKDSVYQTHFRPAKGGRLSDGGCSRVLKRFQRAHDRHHKALAVVEDRLARRKVPYRKVKRGSRVPYDRYDLIVSVGGDGTFLDAARFIRQCPILGVNSDPQRSVGRFCSVYDRTFGKMLDQFLNGHCSIVPVDRLRVAIPALKVKTEALNEVLVCQRHPAVMSHYVLKIGRTSEEQRSSGVWVSSAAGSSGAIRSAGGKVLKIDRKVFQYRPRELYPAFGKTYQLTGATFSNNRKLRICSLMTQGMCSLDGGNVVFPLSFADELVVSRSPYPLWVVGF